MGHDDHSNTKLNVILNLYAFWIFVFYVDFVADKHPGTHFDPSEAMQERSECGRTGSKSGKKMKESVAEGAETRFWLRHHLITKRQRMECKLVQSQFERTVMYSGSEYGELRDQRNVNAEVSSKPDLRKNAKHGPFLDVGT